MTEAPVILVDIATGHITHPQPAVKVETARGIRWHVDHCPGCGQLHSHKTLGIVRAPCGAEYHAIEWWRR